MFSPTRETAANANLSSYEVSVLAFRQQQFTRPDGCNSHIDDRCFFRNVDYLCVDAVLEIGNGFGRSTLAAVNRDERIVRPTLDLEAIELVTDLKLRFAIFDDPAIVMKVPLKGHAEIVLACPSLETWERFLNW